MTTYSDFLTNFDIHPVTGDLFRAVDVAAVKRALRNLIMTNKGERFFQPNLGSSIRQFLFEPMLPTTQYDLQNAIKQCIGNYEPRVNLIAVNVVSNFAIDSYDITIIFTILNIATPTTLNITLQRLR